MNEINVGSVVQLKSGSLLMTVQAVKNELAEVIYQDYSGEFKLDVIKLISLKLSEAPISKKSLGEN